MCGLLNVVIVMFSIYTAIEQHMYSMHSAAVPIICTDVELLWQL